MDTEPCPCGRGLPVLREIQGRSTDFVLTSDGVVVHGLALIYVLRDLPGIERFKIVQHDLYNTEVVVIADEHYSLESDEHIATAFRARLGSNVNVSIKHVSEIPAESNGKFRYVVSRVVEASGTGRGTPLPLDHH